MADKSRILKWALFAFTVVFWTIGGLMMGVGFYSVTQKNEYTEFTSSATDPGAVILAVGFIIFFVSFAGTIGALRENTTCLRVYEVFIIIVVILQFIGGILGFAFWPEIKESLDTQVKKMITKYPYDVDLKNAIDLVQERISGHSKSSGQYRNQGLYLDDIRPEVYFFPKHVSHVKAIHEKQLECCGSLNYHDWDLNRYYRCYVNPPKPIQHCSVPFSCCRIKEKQRRNYQCGYQMRSPDQHRLTAKEFVYTRGCLDVLEHYFKDNLVLVAAVAIAFLLPEVIGIVLTHFFIDNIKERIDKIHEDQAFENRPPKPAGPSQATGFL